MKKIEKVENSYEMLFSMKDEYICKGDSGGAIQVEFSSGVNYIIGILTSYEPNGNLVCGNQPYFTNVTAHIDWIESIAFSDF